MEDNTLQPTRKYVLLETLPDGTEVRQYPNGDIRNQNGQVMQLPERMFDTMISDSETAVNYRKRRSEKILRAIEQKVMDVTRTNVPAEAIGAIVAKRAQIAMNDDTRTGNEAAKIVLQALDAYQPKPEESRTNVLRHEYAMDDETMRMMQRIIEQRRTNVLDIGSATDTETTDDYTNRE